MRSHPTAYVCRCQTCRNITMDVIASPVTSITIVYATVYSDIDQRKHQSSASLAFVWGIHRGPVNSPHMPSNAKKCFHLMTSSWLGGPSQLPRHLLCWELKSRRARYLRRSRQTFWKQSLVYEMLSQTINGQRKHVGKISNNIVSVVLADDLALVGTRTSADTVESTYAPCIFIWMGNIYPIPSCDRWSCH